MAQNSSKSWDTFFGPDPLAGRVNNLTLISYKKSIYSGPISNQSSVKTFNEALALAVKLKKEPWEYLKMEEMVSPVKLSKKRSLDLEESALEPRTTFAAIVASNPAGNHQYCSFCKGNREGPEVYSTHTTNNCLILKGYICSICGLKGHTISHCKMNASGSSFVTNMRRAEENSRLYDINFATPNSN